MKTDDLINMLSTNVEPVKGADPRNLLAIALAIGAVAALCLMLAMFGVPANALGEQNFSIKVLALAFTLGVVAAGTRFLIKSARPGEPGRKALALLGLLFFAFLLAGIVALALAHPAAWGGMIFGPQWAACLICIPLFAIAPFVSLIWALRREAPTHLARTGAVVGMVAGALGAAIFALHHPGGSIPFLVLWYGGPIVLCSLVGVILGPRLLRW
jgi:hypothetical protein